MDGSFDMVDAVSAKFVEALTSDKTGEVYGYRLKGRSPGPQVVVAGSFSSASEVYDRLLQIPSLPWMRGSIVLVDLERLEAVAAHEKIDGIGAVDRTITLPWIDPEVEDDAVVRSVCQMILGICAELGMVTGRGIYPPRSKLVDRYS